MSLRAERPIVVLRRARENFSGGRSEYLTVTSGIKFNEEWIMENGEFSLIFYFLFFMIHFQLILGGVSRKPLLFRQPNRAGLVPLHLIPKTKTLNQASKQLI